MLFSILIGIGYYASFHSSMWQETIGKQLIKIKVTTMEGRMSIIYEKKTSVLGLNS